MFLLGDQSIMNLSIRLLFSDSSGIFGCTDEEIFIFSSDQFDVVYRHHYPNVQKIQSHVQFIAIQDLQAVKVFSRDMKTMIFRIVCSDFYLTRDCLAVWKEGRTQFLDLKTFQVSKQHPNWILDFSYAWNMIAFGADIGIVICDYNNFSIQKEIKDVKDKFLFNEKRLVYTTFPSLCLYFGQETRKSDYIVEDCRWNHHGTLLCTIDSFNCLLIFDLNLKLLHKFPSIQERIVGVLLTETILAFFTEEKLFYFALQYPNCQISGRIDSEIAICGQYVQYDNKFFPPASQCLANKEFIFTEKFFSKSAGEIVEFDKIDCFDCFGELKIWSRDKQVYSLDSAKTVKNFELPTPPKFINLSSFGVLILFDENFKLYPHDVFFSTRLSPENFDIHMDFNERENSDKGLMITEVDGITTWPVYFTDSDLIKQILPISNSIFLVLINGCLLMQSYQLFKLGDVESFCFEDDCIIGFQNFSVKLWLINPFIHFEVYVDFIPCSVSGGFICGIESVGQHREAKFEYISLLAIKMIKRREKDCARLLLEKYRYSYHFEYILEVILSTLVDTDFFCDACDIIDERFGVVFCVSRKIDVRLWPRLFQCVTPEQVYRSLLHEDKLESAAAFLVVLYHFIGIHTYINICLDLLESLIDAKNYVTCKRVIDQLTVVGEETARMVEIHAQLKKISTSLLIKGKLISWLKVFEHNHSELAAMQCDIDFHESLSSMFVTLLVDLNWTLPDFVTLQSLKSISSLKRRRSIYGAFAKYDACTDLASDVESLLMLTNFFEPDHKAGLVIRLCLGDSSVIKYINENNQILDEFSDFLNALSNI